MNNEERDLIARFVARVGGASQGGGFGSSVPATRTNLPPIDPEADNFIHQQLAQSPEATYRITQMAVVQEAALAEAQNRLQHLQWENAQLRQQAQAPAPGRGGLFGGLFGGGQRAAAPPPGYGQQQGYGQGGYAGPPPPQPQYPPNMNPGMFQRQGSGFLGSALTTAAGVAGGMVAGNALMNMFEGGHQGGGFGGGGFGGGEMGGGGGWGGDAAGGGDPFGGAGANAGADPWGGGGGDPGGDASGWGDGGGDFGGGGGGDDGIF